MCKRKFLSIRNTHRYSEANFGTFFMGHPVIQDSWLAIGRVYSKTYRDHWSTGHLDRLTVSMITKPQSTGRPGFKNLRSRKTESCDFPTDSCKFPTAKLVIKIIKNFQLNSHVECVQKWPEINWYRTSFCLRKKKLHWKILSDMFAWPSAARFS